MEILELNVEKRTITGKAVKNIRKEGWIPAVIYGSGISSRSIQVKYNDFSSIYDKAGENTLLTILGKPALIHEVMRDPKTRKFTHIDFYEVKMDEKVHVKIPIIFTGESEAANNLGGIIVKNLHEIEIEALSIDLPKELIIDISPLKNLDDHIKIEDVHLPPNVKVLEKPNKIIVSVVIPKIEEEIVESAEAEKEKIESVKVETEEKKKEKEIKTNEENSND